MNIAVAAIAITIVAAQPKMRKHRVTTNAPMIFGLDPMPIMTTMVDAEITPLMTAATDPTTYVLTR